MNVHQIHNIDYIPERRLVIIIEPFHSRGSLKDLIYQVIVYYTVSAYQIIVYYTIPGNLYHTVIV